MIEVPGESVVHEVWFQYYPDLVAGCRADGRQHFWVLIGFPVLLSL